MSRATIINTLKCYIIQLVLSGTSKKGFAHISIVKLYHTVGPQRDVCARNDFDYRKVPL